MSQSRKMSLAEAVLNTGIGYLVAVRSKDGGAWTYLDGAGLRTRPGLLYRLLPDLERDIPLPPNTLE